MPVYEIKDLNIGINTSNPEISDIYSLDTSSFNMCVSGLNGIGPRQGVLSIPGQNETLLAGLQGTEGTAFAYKNRVKVFGTIPTKSKFFWVTSSDRGSFFSLDVVESAVSALASPIGDAGLGTFNDGSLSNLHLSIQKRETSNSYVPFSFFTVKGRDLSQPFLIFRCSADSGASNPGLPIVNGTGWTSEMQSGKFFSGARAFKIQGLFLDSGKTYFSKVYEYDSTTLTLTALATELDTTPYTAFGNANRTTARLTTPTFTNGTAIGGLVFDPLNKHNTSYSIAAFCSDNPIAAIWQDGFVCGDGTKIQWNSFDENKLEPKAIRTKNEAGTSYTEDGIPKATCWAFFPNFDSATPLSTSTVWDGTIHVRLGVAGTGILLKNTVYEITFSVYDSQLDIESNVGTPAQFLTGSDDGVAITLVRRKETTGTNVQICPRSMNIPFPPFAYTTCTKENWMQYRVYFREKGTFEWRPAGMVWEAELYDATRPYMQFCEGDDVALPGGQPGGFNDYSSLPKDTWLYNQFYKDRLFWLSKRQLVYSNRNSPFTYPVRNSISCPTGEFKGCIIHAFYGQSIQEGRLVVFSSDAMYVGTFTGVLIETPVQVSTDTVASFGLDGSDFTLNLRTSITAFSSRAAIVVEGLLYFWGPQGVFIDSGVQVPSKVSQTIEPWLESIYDTSRTDEIHCVYDSTTKDITWFYSPKDVAYAVTTPTEALVYNVKKNVFHRHKFNQKIESAQTLNILQEDTTQDVGGQRTIIHTKLNDSTDVSRAFFYDSKCKCGDTNHAKCFLVKQISEPSVGLRRLTLEPNISQAIINGIYPNDYVYLVNAEIYSQDNSFKRGKYTVYDVGAFYIDIIDSTLPIATLVFGNYIPLQHASQGVDYLLKMRYWAPAGVYAWHEFNRVFISAKNESAEGHVLNLAYKTPHSTAEGIRTTSIRANAGPNSFAMVDIPPFRQTTQGNAFSISFSGKLSSGYYRLEYFALEAAASDARALIQFQG